MIEKYSKTNKEKDSVFPRSRTSKAVKRSKIVFFGLLMVNFLAFSYFGLLWVGLGSGNSRLGAQEWVGIILWAFLWVSLVLSFLKPLFAYSYFFVEIVTMVLFWIIGGDFAIPVFFLFSLMIVAMPYLMFLRYQSIEMTKTK